MFLSKQQRSRPGFESHVWLLTSGVTILSRGCSLRFRTFPKSKHSLQHKNTYIWSPVSFLTFCYHSPQFNDLYYLNPIVVIEQFIRCLGVSHSDLGPVFAPCPLLSLNWGTEEGAWWNCEDEITHQTHRLAGDAVRNPFPEILSSCESKNQGSVVEKQWQQFDQSFKRILLQKAWKLINLQVVTQRGPFYWGYWTLCDYICKIFLPLILLTTIYIKKTCYSTTSSDTSWKVQLTFQSSKYQVSMV